MAKFGEKNGENLVKNPQRVVKNPQRVFKNPPKEVSGKSVRVNSGLILSEG